MPLYLDVIASNSLGPQEICVPSPELVSPIPVHTYKVYRAIVQVITLVFSKCNARRHA